MVIPNLHGFPHFQHGLKTGMNMEIPKGAVLTLCIDLFDTNVMPHSYQYDILLVYCYLIVKSLGEHVLQKLNKITIPHHHETVMTT